MMANSQTTMEFEPDWAVPPGATIAAILASNSMSQETLAQGIGENVETVQRLILGLERISSDMAGRLAKSLGSTPRFWMNREREFRASSERSQRRDALNARESWIRQFPAREMASLGWIRDFRTPAEAADLCLALFDVPDVASWQARYAGASAGVAFRLSKTSKSNPGAVVAWLRWAELIANRIPCASWDARRLEKQLHAARRLTWQKNPATFIPALRKLCADAGVALVVARTPKGCPASGATRFLPDGRAMIVLSFRYRSDDQFWFTFFHECGHLVLHARDALFLEDESDVTSEEEAEANEFAQRLLIPGKFNDEFAKLPLSKDDILRFARRVGLAPGIVVGQLQHIGRLGAEQFNWLKRRYSWDQISGERIIP